MKNKKLTLVIVNIKVWNEIQGRRSRDGQGKWGNAVRTCDRKSSNSGPFHKLALPILRENKMNPLSVYVITLFPVQFLFFNLATMPYVTTLRKKHAITKYPEVEGEKIAKKVAFLLKRIQI